MSVYCLEMTNIKKEFNGLKALDKANFYLKKGEVHALLGINGAGKSTLIKVLSGVYIGDGGHIKIDGKDVVINSPHDAMTLGVSTVYQDPQMIESYTGYENIYLGRENKGEGIFSTFSRRELKQKAEKLLEQYPLDIDLESPVYLLSAIEREILAVLRALSKECHILVLDEPTSILTDKEKHVLFDMVKVLKERGVSIIYITHHLDEVGEICDRFTVFRNGKDIKEVEVKDHQVDPAYIAELMLGEPIGCLYPDKVIGNTQNVNFAVKDLCKKDKLHNISFSTTSGQILGIFGLVGSGIDELSKTIFGAMAYEQGQISKNNKEITCKSPKEAIDQGLYLVPGNRKAEGQVGDLPLTENVTLSKLGRIKTKLKLLNTKKEVEITSEMIEALDISTSSIYKKVDQLSGGNQQKVVIAKGLVSQGDVYIFAEPTVGVDVGAKFKIYEIMRNIAKDKVVIIISSDPEEVLGNSDHVMVMNQGHITMSCSYEETNLNDMLVHAVSLETYQGGEVYGA